MAGAEAAEAAEGEAAEGGAVVGEAEAAEGEADAVCRRRVRRSSQTGTSSGPARGRAAHGRVTPAAIATTPIVGSRLAASAAPPPLPTAAPPRMQPIIGLATTVTLRLDAAAASTPVLRVSCVVSNHACARKTPFSWLSFSWK